MAKVTRHVLKADEVMLDGALRLGVDPVTPPGGKRPPTAAPAASVRIVENHPEYAVIEVTCSCGKTTHVRCEYAARPAPAPADSQDA
jgi:hypothetical protein